MKSKKQTKQKIKDSSLSERRFGVFVEHMDAQFDKVLEGHSALEKEAKDFGHETRSEIRFLNLGLSNANYALKDLSTRVDRSHDETKKMMMDYFSAMDEELKQISKELAAIKSRLSEKAGLEYVASVEKLVLALEGELLKLKKS